MSVPTKHNRRRTQKNLRFFFLEFFPLENKRTTAIWSQFFFFFLYVCLVFYIFWLVQSDLGGSVWIFCLSYPFGNHNQQHHPCITILFLFSLLLFYIFFFCWMIEKEAYWWYWCYFWLLVCMFVFFFSWHPIWCSVLVSFLVFCYFCESPIMYAHILGQYLSNILNHRYLLLYFVSIPCTLLQTLW